MVTIRPTHPIYPAVATGTTREEAEENMHQAVEMHIKGLREDGLPIPESSSFAEYVAIQ